MKLTGLSKFHRSQSMRVYRLSVVTALLHPVRTCRTHSDVNAVGKQPLRMSEHVHLGRERDTPAAFSNRLV